MPRQAMQIKTCAEIAKARRQTLYKRPHIAKNRAGRETCVCSGIWGTDVGRGVTVGDRISASCGVCCVDSTASMSLFVFSQDASSNFFAASKSISIGCGVCTDGEWVGMSGCFNTGNAGNTVNEVTNRLAQGITA